MVQILLDKQCIDNNIIIGNRVIITHLSYSHILTYDHSQCVSLTSFAIG